MAESPEKQNPRLPIGEGGMLEAAKETLPAAEVKNHVLWVNPDFPELPFKLPANEEIEEAARRGKTIPTKLGLFLSTQEKPDYKLEIFSGHRRSGLLGRVIFKDKQGRFYRDVDLKGIGHGVSFFQKPGASISRVYPEGEKTLGILNLADAYKDKAQSEDFLEKGIRTHRVAAIITLEEIVDEEGNKLSVGEAKNRRMLKETDKPVVEVRAYGTKARIHDMHYYKTKTENKTKIKDAMALVAAELGLDPGKFTLKQYSDWIKNTLREQVKLMHDNGWYHGYLSAHNITLDGRITDLDSVGRLNLVPYRDQQIREDEESVEVAISTLEGFLSDMARAE